MNKPLNTEHARELEELQRQLRCSEEHAANSMEKLSDVQAYLDWNIRSVVRLRKEIEAMGPERDECAGDSN